MDGRYTDGLFRREAVNAPEEINWGRSKITSGRSAATVMEISPDRREVRRLLRVQCPASPGVYGMVDDRGEFIYVGMSCQLRERLLTYFTKGPAEAKEQRVAAHAGHLLWEVGDHELVVRLRELELIRRWNPRFNAIGRPGRREIGFIYLTPSEAPKLRFGSQPGRGARRCWGPLPLTRRTRNLIRRLNYLFMLRDCPDRTPIRFAEQKTLLDDGGRPACLRGQVGSCYAPCAGNRSCASYAEGLAAAESFLDGADRSIIDHYEHAMYRAAQNQHYELAASHRDSWQALEILWDHMELLRKATGPWQGVHVLKGHSGKRWWLVITGGRVATVLAEPKDGAAKTRCGRQLQKLFTRPATAESEDFDQLRLVASWYRRLPPPTDAILAPAAALQKCSVQVTPAG